MIRAALLLAVFAAAVFGDIQAVMSEPNLEKRSERALANADQEIIEARKHYQAQDGSAFQKALAEARQSVELCYKSLKDSGKVARKSPKYFKRAEMRLREIGRRLDNMEKDVLIDDRAPVTALKQQVEDMADQIVLDIMTKK